MTKIAFIGGGNMANAIIGGLIATGVAPEDITVSDPYEPSRASLNSKYGISTTDDNNSTIMQEDSVLVLAVKPQVMKQVATGIAQMVGKFKPLIITIAAGITIPDLERWLACSGISPPIVRCMPNTPALVSEGASGVFATDKVSTVQKQKAESILRAISKKLYWVDSESLIDVVTGVSGSGPAYFFYMIEAMEKAGVELGLPLDVARGLAAQTCLGAGKMLTTLPETPEDLRKMVTSPNGTTQAALDSMRNNGFERIVADAVSAATTRGAELGKVLGSQV